MAISKLTFLRIFFLRLVSFSVLLSSMSLQAQICSVPVIDQNTYGLVGIGDGCTLKSQFRNNTLNAEWIPHIGFFKGTFTGSCDRHDKCLTQIGNLTHECNSEFYSNLRQACDDRYNWYQPAERALCHSTAYEYYRAVEAFQSEEMTRSLQSASVTESLNIGSRINALQCGTTPERTQLYSGRFMESVNNRFLSIAGRRPTTFEFFEAANSISFIEYNSSWESNLTNLAYNALYRPAPPTASFSINSIFGLRLNAQMIPGATYFWKVNSLSSQAQTMSVISMAPRYNTTYSLKGFLVVQQNGIRNMELVDQRVTVIGTCGPSAGQPCY